MLGGLEGVGTGVADSHVAFGEEVGPACESRGHEAAVDVVEGLSVGPVVFDIFNHETEVGRDAGLISRWSMNREGPGTYKAGWMGDRSTPIT